MPRAQATKLVFANISFLLLATSLKLVSTPSLPFRGSSSDLHRPNFAPNHPMRRHSPTPALLHLSGLGPAVNLLSFSTPPLEMPTTYRNTQEQTSNVLGAAGDGVDARGVR
jgi:hypothetical protein